MNKRMRKKATKKSNKKQIVLAVLNASMLMAPALAPVLAPSVLVAAAEEITTNTDAYKGIVNDITKEPYEVKVQQLTDTTPVVTGFNLAIYDATTNTTVYKRYESLMNMSLIVQEYKTSPQNFLTAEQFKAQHPLKDNDTLYLLTKQDIEEAPQPTELSFPNLHHREHIVYDPMTKQYYYFLAADTIITDINYRPGLIDSNSLVTQFRGVSFMKSATLDPNLLISHTADKPTKHGLHDMGNMYDIEVEEQPDFTDWAPESGIVKNYGLTKTIRWRYVQKNEQGEVVFREANWRETTVHIGYSNSENTGAIIGQKQNGETFENIYVGDLIAKQPYEDYSYIGRDPNTGRGGYSRTAKVVYNDFATYKVNGMDFSKLPAPIRDELFASELSVPGTRGELPKDKDAAFDPTFKAGYNGNYYEDSRQVDGEVIKYDGYMVNPYRPTTVNPGAGPIKLDPKQTFPEQIYDDRGYPFTEELFKAGSIKVAQDKTVSRVFRENVNVAEQSHSIAGITGDDFALISGRLGEMQATTSGYWDYAIASVPRTEIASDATKLNLTVIEANVKDTTGSVYADYIALDEQGNVTETKLQETKTIVDKQPKDTDYALNTDNNKPDTFEHNGKTYKLAYSTLKVNDQDATYSDTGKVVKGNINATHYYAPVQEEIIEEDLTATLRVEYYDWDTKLPFPQVPNGLLHKSGVVGKAQYKQKYYIDQNKQRVEISKEKIGNVITEGVSYDLVEDEVEDQTAPYGFSKPIIDYLTWQGTRTTDNPDTSGENLDLNLLHEKTEFVNVHALNGEFYTDAVVKFYYNRDWKYDSSNKEQRESEERGTLIVRYVDEDGKEIATPYTHTNNEVVGRTTYEVAVIDEYADETSDTPIASNPVENVRYNEEYTSENVSYDIENDTKNDSTGPVKPATIGDYTFIGSDAAIPLSGNVPRGTNVITLVYKKNTPATPTPDPVTYTVTHRFEKAESVPADVNLPAGLLERITEEKNYTNVPEGEEKTPNSEIATTTYTEPDTGRTWKFVGWKQDKLAPSAQTPNPEFVGVWELVYKVTHEFQKAEGVTKDLPAEIKSKIASSHNYTEVPDGTTKEPNSTIDKSDFVDEVNDGTWTFANWDKNSVTINDANEQFIGYWNFTPNKYKITHEFKVADGVTKELPEVIKSRITEASNLTDLLNGSDNKPNSAISTDAYVDETNDGTWTFTGWDKDNHVINKKDGHFVGTWTFTPKTYNVTHTFVKAESVPENIELPEAIKSKIESSHNYTGVVNGDSRTPNSDINTDRYEDADNDGVWTFNRWQQDSVTVEKADAELVGEWNFTPNPKGTVKIVYKALDKNGAVDDKVTLRNEVVDTPSSPVDTPWNAAEQEKDEKPETLTHEATNTVYHLVKTAVVVPGVDGESTQTEGTVVAGETVVTYYYAPEQVEEGVIEEKGNVTVKYETESGKTLKSDYKDSENVLVSSTPTTRRYYLKDGNKVYLDEQPVRGTTTKTDATYDTREDKSETGGVNEKPSTLTDESGTTYHLIKTKDKTPENGTLPAGDTVVTYVYAPEQTREVPTEKTGSVIVEYKLEGSETTEKPEGTKLQADFKDTTDKLVSTSTVTETYYVDANGEEQVIETSEPVVSLTNATYEVTKDEAPDVLTIGGKTYHKVRVTGTENGTLPAGETKVTYYYREEKPAKVVHEFVSGTPGKELPQEVKDLLPSGFDTKFDETVEPKQPTKTTVEVSDGTWTFTSYDETSKVVDEAEEKFVGTWTFTPKKPDGNNPGDNGDGETVTEKGNVVVKHYKVGTTEEVRNGRTLPEENVGTQYNVTADKVTGEFVGLDGKTYEYVSDTDNTTGNIVKGTTEVIYYYREVPTTPEEPTPPTTTPDNPGTTTPDNPGDNGDGETVTEKGNVVVKHYKVGTTEEVRNGRTLPEENVGTQYNVTADKVTGEFVGLDGKTYEYVSDTNNTTGNIVKGTTEVIYYYREVPTTPEGPTPPTTTPDNPGTTTPDNPGTTTPGNPGTTTPDNPGTTTPDNPGTTTPGNPGTTTPDNPGTPTPPTGTITVTPKAGTAKLPNTGEASTSPLYGVLAFATGLAGLFGLVKKKKEEDQ